MTNLETLVGMKYLWESEEIVWKVLPEKTADTWRTIRRIENWVRKFLKELNEGRK